MDETQFSSLGRSKLNKSLGKYEKLIIFKPKCEIIKLIKYKNIVDKIKLIKTLLRIKIFFKTVIINKSFEV